MYNCAKFHHCGISDFMDGGKHFILHYFFVDWKDELNAGNSTKVCLDKINILLDILHLLKLLINAS